MRSDHHHLDPLMEERLLRLHRGLEQIEGISFSDDPATDAFCRERLQAFQDLPLLRRTLREAFGKHTWRPLGMLLLVISESDPLGTLSGFLGAFLTGNRMRLKARRSLTLLQHLKDALSLPDEACTILDWESAGQDDRALLRGVDGVVLAGGEDLIRHYRRVTPASVRLIEFGPKLSALVLDPAGEEAFPLDTLVAETTLFLQEVCSSPRFILLPDPTKGQRLLEALRPRLSLAPTLPLEQRLAQFAKARELALRQSVAVHDPHSGWGITLTPCLAPDLWLPKGFQIITGPLRLSLDRAAALWPGRLQTVGYWGREPTPDLSPFTRICPLGVMHCRPLSASHDGFFPLPALVSFVSRETVS